MGTFSDKIKPACLPTSATKDYSGKASTISGWGGTKAYEPLTFVNQPGQCGLKEGIVNILKSTDKKCEDFMGDSTSTTQMSPGPRVQTPARATVGDHLQLLRTESTCS